MKSVFSIITPSYNHRPCIEDTINSILSQSGDFYLDYIVADGGSKDGTVEILKKYEELITGNKYPIKCLGVAFRWWSHKDNGQTDAINKGFAAAKGDILGYLNSDDIYVGGALQRVCNEFARSGADLIYGNCTSFFDSGSSKEIRNIPPSNVDFKYLTKNGPVIFQPSSFWTKNIYDKVGPLDVHCHYAMDYEYYLRILRRGKAAYLDAFLSKFRVIHDQKSGNRKDMLKEFLEINKKYNGGHLSWYYLKTFPQLLFL